MNKICSFKELENVFVRERSSCHPCCFTLVHPRSTEKHLVLSLGFDTEEINFSALFAAFLYCQANKATFEFTGSPKGRKLTVTDFEYYFYLDHRVKYTITCEDGRVAKGNDDWKEFISSYKNRFSLFPLF